MKAKEENHGEITVIVTLLGRLFVVATKLRGGRKMMTQRERIFQWVKAHGEG